MKDLNTKEINLVLDKIRSKYDLLISRFNKSPSLKAAFEDRYITTLKLRKNLTVFLFAEIEAIESLIKTEEEKNKERIKEKYAKPVKSFADTVLEQNKKRYSGYSIVKFNCDADDEIAYLCGASRSFLNEYMPALSVIAGRINNSVLTMKINKIYNEMTEHINYKGEVPIVKHYISAIESSINQSRMMLEYQKAIQNIGFLLNSAAGIIENLAEYLKDSDSGRIPLKKILQTPVSVQNKILTENPPLTLYDFSKISLSHLKKIISDFRLKDIKKV